MKYFSVLILIIIKLSLSDKDNNAKPGQKEFQNLEKKTKALACSFLSNTFISLSKDYDKKFQELLKENKFIQNESEAKEKIAQFMMVNCYLKITSDMANKLILDIPKKNIDIKNKQYLNLFEMDKKTDFKKIAETLKEINEIMKEIKAEEEIFTKKRKEDPNFEKNLKDFEEKMKKNYEQQKKTEKNKNNNAKSTKKKKGNGKKPYEGTKWEIVESSEENILNFSDIIFNPRKFFDVTGLNTVCGMIILTLIIINISQIVNNVRNKKNIKIEKEDKINENDLEEINKENDDNEEEEVENDDQNINNKENDNVMLEKENENDNNIIEENEEKIEKDEEK